ncbi:unnamed protein product [Withania somnifera]
MALATSSWSSFGSILVLCLIVASLMIPSTSNYLSDMCIKSKSPRFCLQVFGLNPHRRPYELTLEAIDFALANTSETTKRIHTFLDGHVMPFYSYKQENLKEVYNYCLKYYQSVVDVLGSVEEHLLKQGLYSSVNPIENFIQEAGFYCENKFESTARLCLCLHSYVHNNNPRIFGSIIMVAADLLSNSTSTRR